MALGDILKALAQIGQPVIRGAIGMQENLARWLQQMQLMRLQQQQMQQQQMMNLARLGEMAAYHRGTLEERKLTREAAEEARKETEKNRFRTQFTSQMNTLLTPPRPTRADEPFHLTLKTWASELPKKFDLGPGVTLQLLRQKYPEEVPEGLIEQVRNQVQAYANDYITLADSIEQAKKEADKDAQRLKFVQSVSKVLDTKHDNLIKDLSNFPDEKLVPKMVEKIKAETMQALLNEAKNYGLADDPEINAYIKSEVDSTFDPLVNYYPTMKFDIKREQDLAQYRLASLIWRKQYDTERLNLEAQGIQLRKEGLTSSNAYRWLNLDRQIETAIENAEARKLQAMGMGLSAPVLEKVLSDIDTHIENLRKLKEKIAPNVQGAQLMYSPPPQAKGKGEEAEGGLALTLPWGGLPKVSMGASQPPSLQEQLSHPQPPPFSVNNLPANFHTTPSGDVVTQPPDGDVYHQKHPDGSTSFVYVKPGQSLEDQAKAPPKPAATFAKKPTTHHSAIAVNDDSWYKAVFNYALDKYRVSYKYGAGHGKEFNKSVTLKDQKYVGSLDCSSFVVLYHNNEVAKRLGFLPFKGDFSTYTMPYADNVEVIEIPSNKITRWGQGVVNKVKNWLHIPIPPSIEPYDIIITKRKDGVEHAGIYLGGGWVLHLSSVRNRPTVSRLENFTGHFIDYDPKTKKWIAGKGSNIAIKYILRPLTQPMSYLQKKVKNAKLMDYEIDLKNPKLLFGQGRRESIAEIFNTENPDLALSYNMSFFVAPQVEEAKKQAGFSDKVFTNFGLYVNTLPTRDKEYTFKSSFADQLVSIDVEGGRYLLQSLETYLADALHKKDPEITALLQDFSKSILVPVISGGKVKGYKQVNLQSNPDRIISTFAETLLHNAEQTASTKIGHIFPITTISPHSRLAGPTLLKLRNEAKAKLEQDPFYQRHRKAFDKIANLMLQAGDEAAAYVKASTRGIGGKLATGMKQLIRNTLNLGVGFFGFMTSPYDIYDAVKQAPSGQKIRALEDKAGDLVGGMYTLVAPILGWETRGLGGWGRQWMREPVANVENAVIGWGILHGTAKTAFKVAGKVLSIPEKLISSLPPDFLRRVGERTPTLIKETARWAYEKLPPATKKAVDNWLSNISPTVIDAARKGIEDGSIYDPERLATAPPIVQREAMRTLEEEAAKRNMHPGDLLGDIQFEMLNQNEFTEEIPPELKATRDLYRILGRAQYTASLKARPVSPTEYIFENAAAALDWASGRLRSKIVSAVIGEPAGLLKERAANLYRRLERVATNVDAMTGIVAGVGEEEMAGAWDALYRNIKEFQTKIEEGMANALWQPIRLRRLINAGEAFLAHLEHLQATHLLNEVEPFVPDPSQVAVVGKVHEALNRAMGIANGSRLWDKILRTVEIAQAPGRWIREYWIAQKLAGQAAARRISAVAGLQEELRGKLYTLQKNISEARHLMMTNPELREKVDEMVNDFLQAQVQRAMEQAKRVEELIPKATEEGEEVEVPAKIKQEQQRLVELQERTKELQQLPITHPQKLNIALSLILTDPTIVARAGIDISKYEPLRTMRDRYRELQGQVEDTLLGYYGEIFGKGVGVLPVNEQMLLGRRISQALVNAGVPLEETLMREHLYYILGTYQAIFPRLKGELPRIALRIALDKTLKDIGIVSQNVRNALIDTTFNGSQEALLDELKQVDLPSALGDRINEMQKIWAGDVADYIAPLIEEAIIDFIGDRAELKPEEISEEEIRQFVKKVNQALIPTYISAAYLPLPEAQSSFAFLRDLKETIKNYFEDLSGIPFRIREILGMKEAPPELRRFTGRSYLEALVRYPLYTIEGHLFTVEQLAGAQAILTYLQTNPYVKLVDISEAGLNATPEDVMNYITSHPEYKDCVFFLIDKRSPFTKEIKYREKTETPPEETPPTTPEEVMERIAQAVEEEGKRAVGEIPPEEKQPESSRMTTEQARIVGRIYIGKHDSIPMRESPPKLFLDTEIKRFKRGDTEGVAENLLAFAEETIRRAQNNEAIFTWYKPKTHDWIVSSSVPEYLKLAVIEYTLRQQGKPGSPQAFFNKISAQYRKFYEITNRQLPSTLKTMSYIYERMYQNITKELSQLAPEVAEKIRALYEEEKRVREAKAREIFEKQIAEKKAREEALAYRRKQPGFPTTIKPIFYSALDIAELLKGEAEPHLRHKFTKDERIYMITEITSSLRHWQDLYSNPAFSTPFYYYPVRYLQRFIENTQIDSQLGEPITDFAKVIPDNYTRGLIYERFLQVMKLKKTTELKTVFKQAHDELYDIFEKARRFTELERQEPITSYSDPEVVEKAIQELGYRVRKFRKEHNIGDPMYPIPEENIEGLPSNYQLPNEPLKPSVDVFLNYVGRGNPSTAIENFRSLIKYYRKEVGSYPPNNFINSLTSYYHNNPVTIGKILHAFLLDYCTHTKIDEWIPTFLTQNIAYPLTYHPVVRAAIDLLLQAKKFSSVDEFINAYKGLISEAITKGKEIFQQKHPYADPENPIYAFSIQEEAANYIFSYLEKFNPSLWRFLETEYRELEEEMIKRLNNYETKLEDIMERGKLTREEAEKYIKFPSTPKVDYIEDLTPTKESKGDIELHRRITEEQLPPFEPLPPVRPTLPEEAFAPDIPRIHLAINPRDIENLGYYARSKFKDFIYPREIERLQFFNQKIKELKRIVENSPYYFYAVEAFRRILDHPNMNFGESHLGLTEFYRQLPVEVRSLISEYMLRTALIHPTPAITFHNMIQNFRNLLSEVCKAIRDKRGSAEWPALTDPEVIETFVHELGYEVRRLREETGKPYQMPELKRDPVQGIYPTQSLPKASLIKPPETGRAGASLETPTEAPKEAPPPEEITPTPSPEEVLASLQEYRAATLYPPKETLKDAHQKPLQKEADNIISLHMGSAENPSLAYRRQAELLTNNMLIPQALVDMHPGLVDSIQTFLKDIVGRESFNPQEMENLFITKLAKMMEEAKTSGKQTFDIYAMEWPQAYQLFKALRKVSLPWRVLRGFRGLWARFLLGLPPVVQSWLLGNHMGNMFFWYISGVEPLDIFLSMLPTVRNLQDRAMLFRSAFGSRGSLFAREEQFETLSISQLRTAEDIVREIKKSKVIETAKAPFKLISTATELPFRMNEYIERLGRTVAFTNALRRVLFESDLGKQFWEKALRRPLPTRLFTNIKDMHTMLYLLDWLGKNPEVRDLPEYWKIQEKVYNEIGHIINNYIETTGADRVITLTLAPFWKFYRFAFYKFITSPFEHPIRLAILMAFGQMARDVNDERWRRILSQLHNNVVDESLLFITKEGLKALDWSKISMLAGLNWWQRNFGIPIQISPESLLTLPTQQMYPYLFTAMHPLNMMAPWWRSIFQTFDIAGPFQSLYTSPSLVSYGNTIYSVWYDEKGNPHIINLSTLGLGQRAAESFVESYMPALSNVVQMWGTYILHKEKVEGRPVTFPMWVLWFCAPPRTPPEKLETSIAQGLGMPFREWTIHDLERFEVRNEQVKQNVIKKYHQGMRWLQRNYGVPIFP